MRWRISFAALSLFVFNTNLIAGVPPVNCSFDFECSDGDPCTVDVCDIQPGDPVGSGNCTHTPLADGQAGDCDDGIFCNGYEFCAGSGGGAPICSAGPPASCCDGPCAEQGRCGASSPIAGAPCNEDADCGGGSCERCISDCRVRRCSQGGALAGSPCSVDGDCPGGRCMSADENCADASQCNGAETCEVTTGLCLTGQAGNPCGFGALCFDRQCLGGPAAGSPCRSDSICEGGTCQAAAVQCFTGRCCSQSAEPVCTRKTAAECTGHWYAGDAGYEHVTETGPCGGHDYTHAPGVAWGCPWYGAGISSTVNQSAVQQPVHLVAAGPISSSNSSRNLGSYSGPLEAIGDDYVLQGPYGINLEALRFVGRCESISSCEFLIELRDEKGTLVGSHVANIAHLGEVRTHVVAIYPPIAIPSSGFVVFRAPRAQDQHVAPSLYVQSTDDVDVGGNSPGVMWLNNEEVSNFLPGNAPGILSLELVGDPRLMPTNACCDAVTSNCEELTPWECTANGGNNQTAKYCAQCAGGEWEGSPCRTCQGGSEPGSEVCSGQAYCDDRGLGGICLPNPAVCAGRGRCTNNRDRLCDSDLDCSAESHSCSNVDRFCTLNSDCPAAGFCGGAGTCTFGDCVEADCSAGACCMGTGDCLPTSESSCATLDGDFLGNGTACEPNCCPQPNATGADQSSSAVVHPITVPSGNGAEVTVTISGDNSGASNTAADPDTCGLFAGEARIADLGWWEAFSIDACADVRIDFCCSQPRWGEGLMFLAADAACDSIVVPTPNPAHFNQMASGIGEPHCADGNQWHWFAGLQPGVYYLPVPSSPFAARGCLSAPYHRATMRHGRMLFA